MARKLGLQGKLYRNTGTYASPTWVEITNVRNLTLSVEKGEADLSVRGGNGWETIVATLKKGSIEFDMVYDTEDTNFTALQTAFFSDAQIEFAVMDGPIATTGSQGLRASCEILKFGRNEPLTEGMTTPVMIKPGYSANAPAWYTVP